MCQDMWIPTYLPNYADQVGPIGVVVYMLLARACTYGWEPRWPSVAQLGAMAAVSRSTAERALRALRLVGLIETESCTDEAGQHSNYWDLTDPFDIREKLDSHGAPIAGAPASDGAPPSPVTGGDVTSDGGAPSPVTAPPLRSELKESVCENAPTHTPCAAPRAEDTASIAVALTDLWCAQLPPGAPGWREAHTAEIAWQAGALLQLGWTRAELERSILDQQRDRSEWPRVWAARHGPESLRVARKSSEALRARHAQAQALGNDRKEVARRLASKERYEQLSNERRAEIEARILKGRPELESKQGILRLLAVDLFAAEEAGGGDVGAQ